MDVDRSSYDVEVFSDLDLKGAVLEDLAFYDCRFEGCALNEATLKRSRFVDCVFSRCDLSLTDLTDVELSGVRFEQTALVAVNGSVVVRTLGALELHFDACTLNYATFRNLDLSGSTFERCSAREAAFSEVKLVGASFCGTDFSGSTFQNCDLTNTDFQGAQNYQISVVQNRVRGMKVSFPEALGLLAGLEVEVS